MMRFYHQQHRFYGGVDLHARTLSLHVLDAQGKTPLAQTLPASPDAFRHAVAPFRDGLVVAWECLFAWYWLADLCTAEGIPFVLGHALYLKAIHRGKAKTDKIDAHTSAVLLRGGRLPQAYVYPKGLRATRDLLRRRPFFVRRRAEALVHRTNTNRPYNRPPFPKKLADAANREERDLPERFADPSARKNVERDLALLGTCDAQLRAVELYLTRTAKGDDPQADARLRSVPGVGPVLALIPLSEIHDIRRFPEVGQFLSSARLVRCAHASAGKKQGTGGNQIGNAHRKGAFAEAAGRLLRASEQAKRWRARREKKYGKARALGALAARLGRAVYHLLRKGAAFDGKRLFASSRRGRGRPPRRRGKRPRPPEPPGRAGELAAELGPAAGERRPRGELLGTTSPRPALTPRPRTPDAWISPRRGSRWFATSGGRS
jgi:transposase